MALLRAVEFVAIVSAVVLAVAHELLVNTLPVGAVIRTCWNKEQSVLRSRTHFFSPKPSPSFKTHWQYVIFQIGFDKGFPLSFCARNEE
jgi:hypothetical protein